MTTPTSIVGIQQFAKNRLLSLHDACVSVTQTPKQTKIEKSFEHLRGGKRGRNGKSWLSSVISPGSAGYGRYIVDPNNHKKASPISSSNKNNNSSSNYMLSTAGADMDPNSEFFTAINNYSNAGVNNASRKMKRKEYEDLPRHVPRHVVQPLQEAPHSPSSPIANFSLIPLFALCRNQHQITIATNALKQSNNVNDNNNTEEIVRRRQQNVFLLPSKNFPNWCPSVNFTSINTNNNETENSTLTIISPRHVLPRRLKPIHSAKQDEESSFLISPSFVESDKGRNSQEMNFIVGEGRFVIPEVSDEKKSSNNNNNVKSEDGFEQTGESQIFVSFFQLAVPLPSSLYSVVVSSSSQKQVSQTLALDFWTKKFTLARLLRPSSPSFFQMSEISGLWWYFVWMHRNYSLRWLLDINHLFNPAGSNNNNNNQIETAATTAATKSSEKRSAKRRFFLPSAAGTSSIAKKSGNKKKQANRKNSTQGGGPAEIAIEEEESRKNHKNDKQDAAILSQLLTTFTSRPIRDADNFGQRKSRENARYERYDIGKRRRKGKALKKKSSLLKRKLLKQQQGSSSLLVEKNSNDNKKNGGTKKYSSAQEYILHRLAIKFSLLKPHQLRSLVDHYRLFLHHCNVTCTNEKNLWKLADEKNNNNSKFEATSAKEKSKKQRVVLSSSKAAKLQAASASFASQLTHTSIQLPQETYLDEIKVWREWRFVYSFFPIFALKAAMFGSGLPLKKVVDSSSSNENSSASSSLAKILGFDFILKEDDETKKNQQTSNHKRLTEMTELVCFPNSESSLTAFERISSSSSNSMMMSSGMHKSQILEKNNNHKTSSFMLDPASVLSTKKKNSNNNTNSFKYHLSTELSKLELSLLKTRSGYWVFRNSLPALEPQKWWKHFVVSTTTCARQWEMLKGQQRTLFDTLPLKRKSGERRSDPFFAFLRKRVAEASAMRKAQLEMIRKERRGRGEQQQQQQNNNTQQQEDAEEDEANITKFPFLSKETNLPTTLGQVCAQARRDWNKMHPFEQAQYYDQDAIKQTFPEFEGFKQEDAQLWKSLLEEEEYRQKMLDQMELEERWSYNKNGMFYSDYTNGEDFTLDLNSLNSGNSSSSSVNDQDLGIMSMMMRQNSSNSSSSSRFRQQQQMYYNDPLRYKLGNDEEMSLRSAIMIANNNNNNNKK